MHGVMKFKGQLSRYIVKSSDHIPMTYYRSIKIGKLIFLFAILLIQIFLACQIYHRNFQFQPQSENVLVSIRQSVRPSHGSFKDWTEKKREERKILHYR